MPKKRTLVCPLDHPTLQTHAPYDLIFANILKGPLIALAPGIFQATAPGGAVILSGILNEQADEVSDVYARLDIIEADRLVIGDWTTLTLRRD